MAIRVHCDRCGRFVTFITERSDMSQFRKEVVCKQCDASEKKLVQFADSLKGKWSGSIEKIISDAKAELTLELSKIKASHGKED